MENVDVSLSNEKKKMGYASLIISFLSIVALMAAGLVVVSTEAFGSFSFFLKNLFLFFGYLIVTPLFNPTRIIIMALYVISLLLPLVALIVAFTSSRKKKKGWVFPVSIAVSILIFGFYVFKIVSMLP